MLRNILALNSMMIALTSYLQLSLKPQFQPLMEEDLTIGSLKLQKSQLNITMITANQ